VAEWNQCWYCGIGLTSSKRDAPTMSTIDEVIPRSWGSDGKMVMACKKCNNLKCFSSVDEFRAWLGIDAFYGELQGWQPW
jgi:5-methylcytosine-specific restriction endonuclease McrA